MLAANETTGGGTRQPCLPQFTASKMVVDLGLALLGYRFDYVLGQEGWYRYFAWCGSAFGQRGGVSLSTTWVTTLSRASPASSSQGRRSFLQVRSWSSSMASVIGGSRRGHPGGGRLLSLHSLCTVDSLVRALVLKNSKQIGGWMQSRLCAHRQGLPARVCAQLQHAEKPVRVGFLFYFWTDPLCSLRTLACVANFVLALCGRICGLEHRWLAEDADFRCQDGSLRFAWLGPCLSLSMRSVWWVEVTESFAAGSDHRVEYPHQYRKDLQGTDPCRHSENAQNRL